MGTRRAYAILLLLVTVVFAASFGVARALRAGPEPPSPPAVVVAPALRLVEPGAPAQIPALRAPPRPPAPSDEE
jgi:hypothetical protein